MPPNPTSSSSSATASVSPLSTPALPPSKRPSPTSASASSPFLCSHCARSTVFPSTAACGALSSGRHSR